jgi:hypothetical protein
MNKETVEEVAGKSATESHPICMITVDDTTFDTNHHAMIAHFHGFIAGSNWQKEQSTTDAIQFAEWLDIETKQSENRWFIERSEGYTYPNLYKLWLKTKDNANN